MLAESGGSDTHRHAMWDDNENTLMVPTFSAGSFFADRYRVDSLLGSGAMGRVYAATELHSPRRVAIKVLHRERLGEEETVERFKREADVLASIGHPCIVEIYAFHHTADGTPYLAMELLEGVTLKTRLKSGGRFEDPRELSPIVDGICGALGAAHARGVVHRDLKPDNVFLMASGEPRAKLVDFGLSRMAKMDLSLTQSGMILGTPRYMAPEQIKDATAAGPRGDIYALGVILFECLAGKSPYPAEDYGQLLGCVLEGRTDPLERSRPDLPTAISEVIRRAMAPAAADRFPTCAEMADAFGVAIGVPSQRLAIANAASRAPRPRRKTSGQSMVASKSSTLAFDGSAAREMLEELARAAPGNAGPASTPFAEPGSGIRSAAPAGSPSSAELVPPAPSWSASTSGESAPSWSASTPGQPLPAPPLAAPPLSTPPLSTPPLSTPPLSTPPLPARPLPAQHLPAQGGDTMFLPSSGLPPPPHALGAMTPAPLPSTPPPGLGTVPPQGMPPTSQPGGAYSPAPYAPAPYGLSPAPYGQGAPYGTGAASGPPQASYGQPAATPSTVASPKKRRGGGVALFVFALIVVVLLSALAGLALRAYLRGDLELPAAMADVIDAAST